MKKAILYIHGKGGSGSEAEQYRDACPGFEVVGAEYGDCLPRLARSRIRAAYEALRAEYGQVYLIANSIGAYLAMHALQGQKIEKALFISPVLNMERLILDMMGWADVTENELREKGEIPTGFGETLSWEYLSYVRENPVDWQVRTEILYAGGDKLISREAVEEFVEGHDAALTVMEDGEHWFHTRQQLEFLLEWVRRVL